MTPMAEASAKLEALAQELGYYLVSKTLEPIPPEVLPEFPVWHRNKEGVIEGFMEAARSPLEALKQVGQALGYPRGKPAPYITIIK